MKEEQHKGSRGGKKINRRNRGGKKTRRTEEVGMVMSRIPKTNIN
jgi:hypothetical protein